MPDMKEYGRQRTLNKILQQETAIICIYLFIPINMPENLFSLYIPFL